MKLKTAAILAAVAFAAADAAAADYGALKREALKRPRDVMYYGLGFEPCFWPKNLPFKPEAMEKIRLNDLLRTPRKIDTLVYCPIGGFACLSAKIPSAEMPLKQPSDESTWMKGVVNRLPDFVKAGTDPLEVVVKWSEKNKKELVVALPVNSNEHGARQEGKPVLWNNYFWPAWKDKHPGALMGGKGKDAAPRYASATAVDYGQAEVRSQFAAMCKDIADKYAVDGIMVDFESPSSIFKTVANGEKAGTKEWQALTDMMTKIRGSVDAAGQKRGKAILLSARVPDSVGYCKDIGIDLQAWIDAKLLDYVVAGGTMNLNPWSATGELLKKSGVPFYAALDVSGIYVGNDSGYKGDDERPTLRRQSPETFRARMYEAGCGGAAGVMFVQPYHWMRFSLSCICDDIRSCAQHNKRYMVTYVSSGPANASLKEGIKHCTREQLISGSPIDMKGKPAKFGVWVYDDFVALQREGKMPKRAIVTTEASIPSGVTASVTVNGKAVKLIKKIAGSQQYEVPVGALKTGRNEVVVKTSGKNKRGQTAKLGNIAIDVIYDGPMADASGKGDAK